MTAESKIKFLNLQNSEYPGDYCLAASVSNSVLKPEDVLEIELFITGYGVIKNPKVTSFSNNVLFDAEHCAAIHSMKELPNGRCAFGNITQPIRGPDNFSLMLHGISFDKGITNSYIVDIANEEPGLLNTEYRFENAPITFKLKINKGAIPGLYGVEFYFTYFSGAAWICKKTHVSVKVMSFLEIHAEKLTWLGVCTAVVSMMTGIAALCI